MLGGCWTALKSTGCNNDKRSETQQPVSCSSCTIYSAGRGRLAYSNHTMSFDAVVAKERNASELEEMTIFRHTVPLHYRGGISARLIRPKAAYIQLTFSRPSTRPVFCCKLRDVGHSATWPRCRSSGQFVFWQGRSTTLIENEY